MADPRRYSTSGGLLATPNTPEFGRTRSRESIGSTTSTITGQRRLSSPGPRPDYLRHSNQASRDSVVTFGSTASTTVNVLRPKKWKPFFLEPLAAIVTIGILVGVAVGLEVALQRSNNNDGFTAGPLNKFGATQFVKSFLPAVVAIPILFLVRKGNQQLKLVAPYAELAKGGSPAKRSLLVNYAQSNAYSVAFKSLISGHFLVTFSCFATIMATFVQPLAGSLFLVRSTARSAGVGVSGLQAIGLNPITDTLIPFVEAAGFVGAAVTNNLTDPPLIHGGWTIPPYKPNNAFKLFQNSTLFINSPAMQSQVQCVPGSTSFQSAGNSTTPNAITMTASLGGGATKGTNSSCRFDVDIDTPTINWQSGVSAVDPSCNQFITSGSKSDQPPDDLAVDFRSVVFWVYSWENKGGSAVFCTPQITAYNVLVESDVDANAIRNVTATGNYGPSNNVTGAPINGWAYNGVAFTNTSTDKFTQARALVSPLTLSDAVLSKGKLLDGGLNTMITNNTAIVTVVAQLYTQFLAVSAASIYFVPAPVTLTANLTVYEIRLWLDPFATHALAALNAVMALILLVVYFLHFRKRRNMFIASEPGSIAAAAALLSQSRFARTLIRANQDVKEIEKTLKGMKFGFDMRTWAIEAEGFNGDDYLFYAKGEGLTPRDDNELEQTGLLASQQMEMAPYVPAYPPSPGRDEGVPLHADSPSPPHRE